MIDLSKPWPFGLSRRNWPWYAAGSVAVLGLLLFADRPLSVLATHQKPDIIAFFTQVTRWGEADWLLIPSLALLVISAILAWLSPRRLVKLALIETIEMYGLIFVGVGLPSLVANILKHLIGRARPVVFDSTGLLAFQPLVNSYNFQGFPSGHTTTAFSAAMVLGFLSPRWLGLGLLYAVAVGVSRMVLDAHYPTDVCAGATLGTLGAYAVRNAFAARGWGFRRLPGGRIVSRPPAAVLRLVRPLQRKAAR